MQKRIADIRREIAKHPARSAWDRGCRTYAEELFNEYIKNLQIKDENVHIEKITEADLLNGANSWRQYSYGGYAIIYDGTDSWVEHIDASCALLYNGDICERLCTKKEAKRKKYGKRKPTRYDSWLDAQTDALKQAAQLVCNIVNRKD